KAACAAELQLRAALFTNILNHSPPMTGFVYLFLSSPIVPHCFSVCYAYRNSSKSNKNRSKCETTFAAASSMKYIQFSEVPSSAISSKE
ncbi:hypothetical protein, partial [Stomatobaculum longum]|uniref:hypothetical protein n=1 Tax=Stomatobaculum longum TaxID=796942 RepID=UPI0028EF15B3